MPLPDRHDCHACIEDFNRRYKMVAHRTQDAAPIHLCDFHDAPSPALTMDKIDQWLTARWS